SLIGAGNVTPFSVYRFASPLEPFECVRDFLQRADLPGDLVDRPAGRAGVLLQRLPQPAREKHERMVVGAVPREVPHRGPDATALFLRQAAAVIDRIGYAKPEQAAIEFARHFGLHHVHPEMAEPPNAKRPRHSHAADDEFLGRRPLDGLLQLHGSLLSLAGRSNDYGDDLMVTITVRNS